MLIVGSGEFLSPLGEQPGTPGVPPVGERRSTQPSIPPRTSITNARTSLVPPFDTQSLVKRLDLNPEASPTIKALTTNRHNENLSGSPLVRSRTLFGREYSFYADGSVLVVDPTRQEYQFLTAQGRAMEQGLQQSAEALVRDDSRLKDMKLLGEGKGGFSAVYEMATPNGRVAVKTTDAAGFILKELMEEASSKAESGISLQEMFGRTTSKKVIQKMSLKDTMHLLKKLDEAGIKTPEFYGFTVRRDPTNHHIQEFQFMEEIDRPTLQSIFETAAEIEDRETGTIDLTKLPHGEFLQDMANSYYHGDTIAFLRALGTSFRQFVADAKRAIPNLGDVGIWSMDNIFLTGYDEQTEKPELMVIDPIEEHVYIRPTETNMSRNEIIPNNFIHIIIETQNKNSTF